MANASLNFTNPEVKGQLMLYDVLIPVLGGLIIFVNLLVVISSVHIISKDSQNKATYLLLGNVALADLLTGVSVIFGQTFPVKLRNQHVCAFQIGLIVSCSVTSIYLVGLIAIDRYLYIVHGLQYKKIVYPNKVRLTVLASWIIGGLVGFTPLMGWSGSTNDGKICWFILLAPKNLILLTVTLGCLPILLVIILYSIIFYKAIKTAKRLRKISTITHEELTGSTTCHETTPEIRMFAGKANLKQLGKSRKSTDSSKFRNTPKKWKAVKVVLFTTGSFVITWLPYFIASFIYVRNCKSINESKYCNSLALVIASPLAILGFANSFINPIIYAWWHKGFQSFVKRRFSIFQSKPMYKYSANTLSKFRFSSRKTSQSQEVVGENFRTIHL